MTRERRQFLFEILELSGTRRRFAVAAQSLLIALILLNVIAVIVASYAPIAQLIDIYLRWFEIASIGVFTIELTLRLWLCTNDPHGHFRRPVIGRLRYLVTPQTLIDVCALVPFYFGLPLDLRFLRAFRLMRALRLTPYYGAAVESLGVVFYNERRSLVGAFAVMMILLIVASCLVYFVERVAQPEAFASIIHAMWWGLATLTTVGYGDVTPITALGRLFGGIVTILGVGMFALPAGILASGYARELRRREFVGIWDLVAEVPLFTGLPAARIADIAAMLEPRAAHAGEIIVRKGDPADCMFFIVEGELKVEVPPNPVTLRGGDFFGEMALMAHSVRTATVTAATQCQLLSLQAQDLAHFLDNNPDLRATLSRVDEERRRVVEATTDDTEPTESPSATTRPRAAGAGR
ncbi:MAG: cyclic nucleotide-gated ion channel [Proteobacteria bacterium]|nr:cyclic nucleotide-gated ion channel [Pseudomonadota bacterium]